MELVHGLTARLLVQAVDVLETMAFSLPPLQLCQPQWQRGFAPSQ